MEERKETRAERRRRLREEARGQQGHGQDLIGLPELEGLRMMGMTPGFLEFANFGGLPERASREWVMENRDESGEVPMPHPSMGMTHAEYEPDCEKWLVECECSDPCEDDPNVEWVISMFSG